jgi:hypothetical protein
MPRLREVIKVLPRFVGFRAVDVVILDAAFTDERLVSLPLFSSSVYSETICAIASPSPHDS